MRKHIINVHNHPVKVKERKMKIPVGFDGWIDEETGNIVELVISDQAATKGEIDYLRSIVESSDDKLQNTLDEVAKRNEEYKAISDKNNATLIEYVFGSTAFGGKKELAISNNSPIDINTSKFIKNIRVVGYMHVYKGFHATARSPYDSWSVTWTDERIVGDCARSNDYNFDRTFSFSDRSIENINLNEPNGFYVILDKSKISSDTIAIDAKPNISLYNIPGSETYTNCHVSHYSPPAGPGSRGSTSEASNATVDVTRYYEVSVYIKQIYLLSE